MSRKVGSLADLKQVKQEIEAQARLAAQRQAEAAAQARRAQSDKEMFTRAVGAVQPMTPNAKVQLKQKPPAPVAMQHHRDEQAVLQEAISDEFDVSTLLDIDEHLSFRRPGIGPDVTRKLRRGDWKIQREIDLHGLRTDDARNALAQFIRKAHREGLR